MLLVEGVFNRWIAALRDQWRPRFLCGFNPRRTHRSALTCECTQANTEEDTNNIAVHRDVLQLTVVKIWPRVLDTIPHGQLVRYKFDPDYETFKF